MPGLIRFLTLLALAALVSTALAQDEEPRHPEEVYRYAVVDTGDALEVDWAIDEGYYLYRNKLSFESATPGIVLSNPRLPPGPASRR